MVYLALEDEWTFGMGVGTVVAEPGSDRSTEVNGTGGIRHGCTAVCCRVTAAAGAHLHSALVKPSRLCHEFGVGALDHDESIFTGDLPGSLGSSATNTIRPRWHCGHFRNEEPVSFS